jgi:hypothetical protein
MVQRAIGCRTVSFRCRKALAQEPVPRAARRKNRPFPGGFSGVKNASSRIRYCGRQLDVGRLRMMLDRVVLVFLETILVPDDLPVELVDHQVDRGVEVAVGAFNEDIFALQMEIDFNLLTLFLFLMIVDREDHIAIDHLIEMS